MNTLSSSQDANKAISLVFLARPDRFERPTPWFEVDLQFLSYCFYLLLLAAYSSTLHCFVMSMKVKSPKSPHS